MIRRLVREPLVHFLALGAVIFASWHWLHPSSPPADEIVIDQAQLEHLETLWMAQWKRDPSPEDLRAILERHLREEVFYREGLRLGLDRNDEIVRRRLAQKMEAISSDVGRLMKPVTDDDLRRFFDEHPDLFHLPPAYTFHQLLYLPAERAEALAALEALRQGESIPESRRDRLGVRNDWIDAAEPDLANAFGDGFAKALAMLPTGEWSGPVESGYGLHLVELERRDAARQPDFESVKSSIRREYDYRAGIEAEDALFRSLLERYTVRLTATGVPSEVRSALPLR
ncbi:MAG: peptidyl-prolyl cis-trans isomerase [Thermoanaerobaculia bacterium]